MYNAEKLVLLVKPLKKLLEEIIKIGGIPYLVGGTVRDLVLNKAIKDVDIEIHKITPEELESCLKKFGKVKFIGKKFGVFRLAKFDIDWSLPRTDSKGRKPEVKIDPNMTIDMACKRRDLTMNAMAINLKDLVLNNFDTQKIKIIDPFGGLNDMEEKRLAAVDKELFLQDPLRFFRVMQFAGRFEMMPNQELDDICKNMQLYDTQLAKPLAKERILEELKKLFLKSKRPSIGFMWLKKIGRLKEVFPEIFDLIGVEQKKKFHPEGDVFEHSMQALDVAANLNEYENDSEKFLIMLGALCHDLGKPETTDENLSCHGHSEKGVPVAKKFLKRFLNNKLLIDSVCKLVLYHIRAADLLRQNSAPKAYKRLAAKLHPHLNLRQLALLTLCDILGRNPKGFSGLKKTDPQYQMYEEKFQFFLAKAREAFVEKGSEKPVLLGRELLDIVKPGPEMGKLLQKAYEIQIDEGIKDKEILKKKVLDAR